MSAPGAASAGQLVQNQGINQRLTDDYTNPQTNEGNLLSLITLQQIIGAGDTEAKAAIAGMAKEETRHLIQAMKMLTQEGKDDYKGQRLAKIQDKYGRDMNAAVQLAKVLKAKGDEKEVDLLLNPFVMDTVRGKGSQRNKRGGFTLKEAVEDGDPLSAYASGGTAAAAA